MLAYDNQIINDKTELYKQVVNNYVDKPLNGFSFFYIILSIWCLIYLIYLIWVITALWLWYHSKLLPSECVAWFDSFAKEGIN